MDNLYCNGSETKISECQFDGWKIHDCSRHEAAGVICRHARQTTNSENSVNDITVISSMHEIRGSSQDTLEDGRNRNQQSSHQRYSHHQDPDYPLTNENIYNKNVICSSTAALMVAHNYP